MAKTTSIKATFRMAHKLGNDYVTLEFAEERAVESKDNLVAEREDLWNTVIKEVEDQVEAIIELNKANKG